MSIVDHPWREINYPQPGRRNQTQSELGRTETRAFGWLKGTDQLDNPARCSLKIDGLNNTRDEQQTASFQVLVCNRLNVCCAQFLSRVWITHQRHIR